MSERNIKYKVIFGILIVALQHFNIIYAHEVLNLSDGSCFSSESIASPTVSVINCEDSCIVSYAISEVIVNKDPDFKDLVLFSIPNFGVSTHEGEPAFLSRCDCIKLPKNKYAKMYVKDCRYVELNYKLGPARQPEHEVIVDSIHNTSITPIIPYKGYCPESYIEPLKIESYRGSDIQYVDIRPILYDYENGKVRILTHLEYVVTFHSAVDKAYIKADELQNLSVDDSLLDQLCINGSDLNISVAAENATTPKDYLILTTDKFLEEVIRFSKWKKTLGFNTHIKTNDNWTVESVKKAINDCYLKNPQLYYLLIVGDYDDIPSEIGYDWDGNYRLISDYKFSCIDNDDLADLKMGRIPVANLSQAKTVFDKIINYEKNPPSDPDFFKRGVNIAYFQSDASSGYAQENAGFVQTSELVRNMMIKHEKSIERVYSATNNIYPKKFYNGNDLPKELQYPIFEWAGDRGEISSLINTGVFYVFHRDHGDTDGWVCPSYISKDLKNLENTLFPVVFSMNCLTGKFDVDECFAESFLRSEHGCIAIYAAGAVSRTVENDILSEEMFKAISNSYNPNREGYKGSILNLGNILHIGIANMVMRQSLQPEAMYNRKIYHCFGDPSMIFLTEMPCYLKNIKIQLENNHLKIHTDSSMAEIIAYDEPRDIVSVFQNDLDLDNSENHNYTICIKSPGAKPYIFSYSGGQTLRVNDVYGFEDVTYVADKVIIGNTSDINNNDMKMIFDTGNIIVEGNNVILEKNVEIKKGVNFNIIKRK